MQAVQGLVVLEIQRRTEASGRTRISTSPEANRLQDLEERFQALEKRFRALEAAKLEDEKALLTAQIAYAKLSGSSRLPTMTPAGAGC
jgi:hypothetical protein